MFPSSFFFTSPITLSWITFVLKSLLNSLTIISNNVEYSFSVMLILSISKYGFGKLVCITSNK